MNHILVPHDGSPASDAALTYARSLGAGNLHAVHVVPRVEAGRSWPEAGDSMRIAAATESLESLMRAGGNGDIELTVLAGDPVACIARRAREVGADMIVMASHGRRGHERALLGSVAERVLRWAPCPVLVIPPCALPAPVPPPSARTLEQQVEDVVIDIGDRVGRRDGYLTAAWISLPSDADPDDVVGRVERRLAAAGFDMVDVVTIRRPGALALVDLCFEDRWAD